MRRVRENKSKIFIVRDESVTVRKDDRVNFSKNEIKTDVTFYGPG